jgi:glutamyl-tRNA synthetase
VQQASRPTRATRASRPTDVTRITRLAPSPTGALHLGNARTFLINWLLARRAGWRILLRIEDLDGPRIKRGADQQLIEDLAWLGIDWDQGPFYQSRDLSPYRRAIAQLIGAGRAYPCICTRSEIDTAASAPHAEDGASIYPGTCRGKYASVDDAIRRTGRRPAIRFAVDPGVVAFDDVFKGHIAIDPARQLGDFVIAKSDGTPAYQLAVVVDDALARITDIVRGDDLIDSTPRQILLYRALGWADRIPAYCHVPLVIGPDRRRLAKRHGDTRLQRYRAGGAGAGGAGAVGAGSAGVGAGGAGAREVLALLAEWCGMPGARPKHPRELIDRFDFARIPRQPIIFDPRSVAAARLESRRA